MLAPLTWNADAEQLQGGATRARLWGKWHNWLADSGWDRIDLSPREAGGTFSVSRAPYSLDVPTLANDWTVIKSTNRYDIWTRRVMADAPVEIAKRYPTASPVAGVITAAGILFALAFPGLNADRLVQLHEQEIRDLVVFRSQPPGQGPVEVPIEIDFGGLPILESTGRGRSAQEADFRNNRDIDHGLSFTTGSFRGLKIKQPLVWDSRRKRAAIHLRGRIVGTRFVGVKVIPRQFWRGATYPVYADTTSTFYPDPHPESTSVDGYIDKGTESDPSGFDWSTLHDAASGTVADDSGTELFLTVESNDTNTDKWNRIGRSFLLFDTSSLPNDASISAAKIALKHSNNFSTDPNFDQLIYIVGSSPASSTAIATADFDQIGSTSFATPVDEDSLSINAYSDWNFNGTGIAAISDAGVSKFAVRLSSDYDDTPPTWAADNQSGPAFYSADQSGTGSDPYLEVTYSSESGITADVAPAFLDIRAITPASAKAAASGQGLVDITAVAPTVGGITAASPFGLLEITPKSPAALTLAPVPPQSIEITPLAAVPRVSWQQGDAQLLELTAPTTTVDHRAAVSPALLDITGVAPAGTQNQAAAGLGRIDLVHVAPTAAKAAASGQGLIDVTPLAAAGSKTVVHEFGRVWFAQPAVAVNFSAASGQGLVDLVTPSITPQHAAVPPVVAAIGSVPAQTIAKGAPSGIGAVDFVSSAPTGSKSVPSGQGLIDVVHVTPTSKHDAASGPVVVDLTSVAPATTKSFASGQGLLDFTGVAPAASHAAAAGIAQVELAAVSPAAAKAAPLPASQIDVLAVTPEPVHGVAAGIGLLDFVVIAAATPKQAAHAVGLVELSVGAIGVHTKKFPVAATFRRPTTAGTFRRPATAGTFRRPRTAGTFRRGVR
jgi:hypothetical protein